MNAASATRFCTVSNKPISQKKMAIVFKRLFTKKCSRAIISTLSFIQYNLTMSICVKINSI